MDQGFADSTIFATIWLISYEPDRLKDWLGRHPPGDVLERVARDWIASGRGSVGAKR